MRPIKIACGAAFTVSLLAQPGIPPGELELHRESYWPPSLKPLTVETRSVEVGVVVRDSNGHAVAGLTRDDFTIEESGKRVDITDFSVDQQAAKPPSSTAAAVPVPPPSPASTTPAEPRRRFLALVFDDFSLDAANLIPTRIAAGHFFSKGMGKEDQASVFFLSQGQIVPFTKDVAKLNGSLAALKPGPAAAALDGCPEFTPYEAYRITEQNDATLLETKVADAKACGACTPHDRTCPQKVSAMSRNVWEESLHRARRTLLFLGNLADSMGRLPGQGVIVLASSGFLAQTLDRDIEDVVDKALRSGVVINALDCKGLYTQNLGLTDNRVSRQDLYLKQNLGTRSEAASNDAPAVLADSTGGVFFHNNNDIELGFRELGLAPQVAYHLAFTPPGRPDNRYHKLTVHLTARKGLHIQARPGYYDLKASPAPPKPELPIDKEVLTLDTPADVPASVTASPVAAANGSPALRVVLHLRVGELPFAVQGGVRRLEVDLIAALFDEHAAFVSGELGQSLFRLKEDGFRSMHDGLNSGLSLTAPPGKYRLRCVVWESNGGKFTAINQEVEIR